MLKRLRKLLGLPRSDALLLIEALALLCWARLRLRFAPVGSITPDLGQPNVESPAAADAEARHIASRIQWAVEAVVRNTPATFVCLPQALAAKRMLRRRHIASTVYIGGQVQPQLNFGAHAWLRVGDLIVTGGDERFGHVVIIAFGEQSSPAARDV